MSNFFDRIRSGAGQAANKAAFEADKLRRVTALQGQIRSLKSDFEENIIETGRKAFTLYQQEQITGPEALRQACEQLARIQAQIAAHEKQIEAVRSEIFVEPQAGQQYGRICPNGHGPISPQDNFCQMCGAAAIEVTPPHGTQLCSNCRAPLADEARFCAECGQEVTQPVSQAASSGESCTNCGAQLTSDSAFCTECGHRVVSAAPEAAVEDLKTDKEAAVAESDEAAESAGEDTSQVNTDLAEASEVLDVSESMTEKAFGLEDDREASGLPLQEKAKIIKSCPVCAAPLASEELFCTECGHQIS